MRKIVVGAFVSVDGVMQAPGGPQEDPTGGFALGGWVAGYFDDVVGAAGAVLVVASTNAYFAELLKDNLGIAYFVQSDFAMLNEPLARLYGVSGVSGWNLRKVVLPAGSVRATSPI